MKINKLCKNIIQKAIKKLNKLMDQTDDIESMQIIDNTICELELIEIE